MSKIKEYKVSFVPFTDMQYDYVVEAKNDDQAYKLGHDWLVETIGWDASKDWECSDIVEVPREKNDKQIEHEKKIFEDVVSKAGGVVING